MDSKFILPIDLKTIRNPNTGENVTVIVKPGTEVWNPHIWDGKPTGSFWRGTEEASVSDGNSTFHVDTNNPGGVLGTFPSIASKFKLK